MTDLWNSVELMYLHFQYSIWQGATSEMNAQGKKNHTVEEVKWLAQ